MASYQVLDLLYNHNPYLIRSPYIYPQAGAIVCDTPSTPINESLRILSAESGLTEGSKIVLQCDDSLLPSHPRTATCVQVLGRGEWVPNLADLHCEGVLHKIASESL